MICPGLIYVTDRRAAQYPLPELAKRAIAGGVDVVQVREKDLSHLELERLVGLVLDRVGDPHRVAVNGSAEVAGAFGVGLHLPERELWPTGASSRVAISRSVHSAESAASSAGADYVIAGHIFATGSKPGLPPIELPGLTGIVETSPVPVLAIGGITPERVARVIAAGASGIAVLSGINSAADPEGAAHAFATTLEIAMERATATVSVTVNGKPAEIAPGITIDAFLQDRNLHERMVVVELNGVIIRRAGFPASTLNEGDKIEIVHFVGGG